MLEMERDPVGSMWRGLAMDARDLKYVVDSLTKAELYYAADFIAVNVLGGNFRVRHPETEMTRQLQTKKKHLAIVMF